jgi:rod shape determining protein RodA
MRSYPGAMLGEAVDRIGGEPITARMARKAPIRHIDPTLLLVTFLLGAYGAVMVFSATVHRQVEAGLDPQLFLKRQIAYLAGGLVVLIIVATFDYRHLRGFAPVVYGMAIVGLGVVLSPLGAVVKGARRWIVVGFVQIQPSELTKIAVIVAVAAFLAERKGEPSALDVVISIGLVAIPSLLIFLEPDLGTMMVMVVLLGALLLVGGARLRHFLALALIAIVAITGAVKADILHDYQLRRLEAFMDPNCNVQEECYNLRQSEIAIASGGFRGKGLESRYSQTALDFVPEQHTDFVFTAVGEQLGFMGSATLIALFAFLIWRAMRISMMSRDLFGTIVAAGIAALWAFQVFVNVGMTMGIMPITGVPLPFISYGGSSLVTNFIAVGLLLNIHMRRFL